MANTQKTEFTADEKQAYAAIDKLQKKVAELEKSLKVMTATGVKGAKETKAAFGDSNKGLVDMDGAVSGLAKKIGAIALAWKGFDTLVGGTKALLNDIDTKRLESLGKLQQNEFGLASLQQLALGDDRKYEELVKQARTLYGKDEKSRGALNLGEAARTIFALESAGMNTEENRQLMKGLFATFEGQTKEAAKQAAGVIESFGSEEAGTMKDVLSKVLGASQFSRATAPELLQYASATAAGGTLLNWTDEQHMAALTALSRAHNIDEAGTELRMMQMGLSREGGMSGKPVTEQVQDLVAMDFSDERLREWLGGDLAAWMEAELPKLREKKGGKTERPFKKMSLKEMLKEMSGKWTESEFAENMGPMGDLIKQRLDQYTSFVGLTPVETINRLQQMNLTPEQYAKMIPKSGIRAFEAFTQVDKATGMRLIDLVPMIEMSQVWAQGTGTAGRVADARLRQSELLIPDQLAASQANTEMNRTYLGLVEGLSQTVENEYDLALKNAGVPHYMRFAHKFVRDKSKYAAGMIDETAGPEMIIRDFGQPIHRAQLEGLQEERRTGEYPADLVPGMARLIEKMDRYTGNDQWERYFDRMDGSSAALESAAKWLVRLGEWAQSAANRATPRPIPAGPSRVDKGRG